jgi:hypothetical protein
MATPNFSPISALNRKFLSTNSGAAGARKFQGQSQQEGGTTRPKYQCPGCQDVFAKWSPCLAHLREKLHVKPELLDKKQNGGDFRKVQEMCATLAHQRKGGSGRERGESTSSAESFSSDSGEDDDSSTASASAQRPRPQSQPKQRSTGATAASLQAYPIPRIRQSATLVLGRTGFNLRMLDEKVIFRLLTFLDVDSSRMLFLAMTVTPQSPSGAQEQPRESRVRLWSMSSDADSAVSLPSASPQQNSGRKRLPLGQARQNDEGH